MSQSKPQNQADNSGPIDEFDHIAEVSTEPHEHEGIPDGYKPGTPFRMISFAAVLVVGLAAGFFLVSSLKAREEAQLAAATDTQAHEPPIVETIIVEGSPPLESLTLPAETQGWYSSTIYARVNGYLTKWFADIGDKVKKDQVLAEIDTPELDAQLDASKAKLRASEAELKVNEAEAEFARTTYQRWEGSAKGVVSDQEREDKKAVYASASAKLNAQEAQVKLGKSNVERLTYLTQFKQVVAPFDGVITARRTDIGDLVTAGSTANTAPLFEMVQYGEVRVFADVPQTASEQIGAGSEVTITASQYPGQEFKGRVARTTQSIDQQARTLRVEADISNSDYKLLPGMYLKVKFNLKRKPHVRIPASALLFQSTGPQVALIRPDNTLRFKDVEVGRDNGNTVDIASGLSAGDRVALNINNQIQDGAKVTVRDNNKMAAN